MAVDLTERVPVAQRQGPLWEALLSALSVAGVFPSPERTGTGSSTRSRSCRCRRRRWSRSGADIVAAVNLLGTDR